MFHHRALYLSCDGSNSLARDLRQCYWGEVVNCVALSLARKVEQQGEKERKNFGMDKMRYMQDIFWYIPHCVCILV